MQYRLVSTIIATHNRPELITRTLDSLSRQTYRPLEVLVIDDGSQPPAQPLIDRWRACVDEDLHVSCPARRTRPGIPGHWLARKYRRGFTSLMRDHVRRSEPGRAKTWVLEGQNSRGWYGAVALRRLVTSRKGQFRWRNPSENPYILRDKTRSTIESRYPDVAFAMSNA